MVSMASILGLLENLESIGISVRQHRCVVVRNRNVSCRRCAEACTPGCISLSDGQLHLELEKCVRCATCATVCPTGAITPKMPDDVKLLKICDAAQAAAGGTVIIACEQALKAAHGTVDIEKAVGVTCLGRVEESLLFQLIQQGVRVVTLVQGTCDSCILAHGLQTASLVAATTNELCMAWNQDARVEISSSFPAEALSGESAIYDSSRRRLFSSIKSEIQSKAARVAGTSVEKTAESSDLPVSSGKSSLPKVTADGTLPHFVPERRQNLLNALNQSGAPEDVLIATRLWGHVIINGDVCESCRMCATFCPTGALAKFDSEDGLFGLLHAPSLCVKCRACQDVCRVHALCLSDEVFAVDLSKGFVERYEMTTPLVEKRSAHSAMNAMRTIIGNDRIYEH